MNHKLIRRPALITVSGAIAISTIASPLMGAQRAEIRTGGASAETRTADDAEPISEQAVIDAIEEYVRARYRGDSAGASARVHEDVARRIISNTYWGQPCDEWVRPVTRDMLTFLDDPQAPQRREDAHEARCEIEVFDIEQQSASARVIMEDAVDYLHMIHVNGRWLIGDSALLPVREPGGKPPATTARHDGELERISRDYCVGFYELDAGKVQGTCHPSMSKRTVEQAALSDGTGFEYMRGITWEEIRLLAETFNREWGFPPDARCEIDIYEVRGNIAAAKLTGTVWFDYFHLMEVNGEWTIVNIMFEGLDRSRWANT